MFTPIIYKEANFHIYRINEKCEVMKNDELLDPEDYIYHSTNGYDYILLEKLDGSLTMYPLDQVIYNSFYPDTQNIYEHFKCIHLNCDLRDNRLENLEGIKEEEEWRMITYPGLPKDTYMISSFGNVTNIKTKKLVGFVSHSGSYMQMIYDNHMYRIHRLVVYEFIDHYDINPDIVINHIDNNSFNNHIMNLEIVTNRQNAQHAILIGVNDGNIRTEEMIKTFCELYVKYEGDIKKVKADLRELNIIDYFDNRFISKLIRKNV